MNMWKHLTAAALALALTALCCGCGQPTADSTPNPAAENSNVSSDAAEPAPAEQEIGSGMTIGMASATASAGQKSVPVNINIWNNEGFAACGIIVTYDAALTPISTGEVSQISGSPEAKIETGNAADRFMTSCLIGEEDHKIAFGAMSTSTSTEDGVMFTCYFDVPEDVASGTEYVFTCEIDSLNDANSQPLSGKTVEGILRIE